jgi:hypothetical protein
MYPHVLIFFCPPRALIFSSQVIQRYRNRRSRILPVTLGRLRLQSLTNSRV